MLPPDNYRRKMMLPGATFAGLHEVTSRGFLPQYTRNTLQLNRGTAPDGYLRFSEIGRFAGIHSTDWSWAPLFADFDNDGFKDLFITNGYRKDVTNLDFIKEWRQQTMFSTADETRRRVFEAFEKLPEVKLPNHIFRNEGGMRFSDRTKEWGHEAPSFSNGAAYADLDLDGDLDLVVNNIDQPAFVYRNRADRSDNHFLRIALMGPKGNPSGIGAILTARHGIRAQRIQLSTSRGYRSSVENVAHFGLGTDTVVDTLEVIWTGGRRQVLTAVKADQQIVLHYADSREPSPVQGTAISNQATGPLLREAGSASGLLLVHRERAVNDFQHTPLLPRAHSRSGPPLADGDVNGDGLEDLFVGGDAGDPARLFLQRQAGMFEERPSLALQTDAAFEDTGALFFDADGDGDLDLFVTSGGNREAPPLEAQAQSAIFTFERPASSDETQQAPLYRSRLYINDGKGGLHPDPGALPFGGASASGVAAGDFDGDGDIDLFIGGRVVPGRYPLPARSRLLRNDSENGMVRFVDVTEEAAPGLSRIGLVTCALWADVDLNGAPDLLLTGEWMPLTLFLNENGRLVNRTEEWGLSGTSGWWNALTAGDFDGDGDIDFIAGNEGLNGPYRPTRSKPLEIWASDFDRNGSYDPVIVGDLGGTRAAVHPRDALVQQIPGMSLRFQTYGDYASAGFDRTFSESELKEALHLQSMTFASSFIENKGNGAFELHELPAEVQLGPIHALLTGDYDGDNRLDVLFAGNVRVTEVESGQVDALVGGLLRGDGAGKFTYVPHQKSGFFVEGDGRALVEIELPGKTRLIVASQNGDSLRVFTSTTDH
jgi:hypothetical protein